jgi:cytidylate kinase
MAASEVSAVPRVRESLLDMQRRLAIETNKTGAVLDGRDIGTVIFSEADVKIFLNAKDETRAQRRFLELIDKGHNVSYENVFNDIVKRDKQDSERETAPLKKADDAIEIDTDNLSVLDVMSQVIPVINRKLNEV